jgi:multidrug efflux pump subunit AcrA (membrane-fusion protein)
LFVQAEFSLGMARNVLCVPSSAVVRSGPLTWVYTLAPDRQHRTDHPFTPAGVAGDKTAIAAGLSEDDLVIVEGLDGLTDADAFLVTTTSGAPLAAAAVPTAPITAIEVTTAHPTRGDLDVTLSVTGTLSIKDSVLQDNVLAPAAPTTAPAKDYSVLFNVTPQQTNALSLLANFDDLALTVYTSDFDFAHPLATSTQVSIAANGPTGGATGVAHLRPSPRVTLFNNQRVALILRLATHHDVLRVPAAAFQHGTDSTDVFVVGPDHIARARPVTRGPEDYLHGLVEITAGLSPDDAVILNPPGVLSSGDPVIPAPAPEPTPVTVVHPTSGDVSRTIICKGLVTSIEDHNATAYFEVAADDADALVKFSRGKSPLQVTVRRPGSREIVATGTVDRIESMLDEKSQTLPCSATLSLKPDVVLIAHQNVNVTVTLETHKDVLRIPSSAIRTKLESNGSRAYQVVTPTLDRHVTLTPVTLGLGGDNFVEVISGLTENDLVITDPSVDATKKPLVTFTPPPPATTQP